MSKREAALRMTYELYEGAGCKQASRELDSAIAKSVGLVKEKIGMGMKLDVAIRGGLKEAVSPVMKKWHKLGVYDTEPEWRIVDVFCEMMKEEMGIKVDAGWDLRCGT